MADLHISTILVGAKTQLPCVRYGAHAKLIYLAIPNQQLTWWSQSSLCYESQHARLITCA